MPPVLDTVHPVSASMSNAHNAPRLTAMAQTLRQLARAGRVKHRTWFGAFGPHFTYDGVFERVSTGVNSLFGVALVIRLLMMQRQVSCKRGATTAR